MKFKLSWGININKLLILFLTSIIIVDLLLVSYYTKKSLLVNLFDPNNKNGTNLKNASQKLPNSFNDPLLTDGPETLPTSKTFSFFGKITDNVYLDSKINQYVIPITFSKDNKNASFLLVLGTLQNTFPIYIAKKNLIPFEIPWIVKSVSKVIPYLKINTRFIINVPYLKDADLEILKEKMNCQSGYCLTRLKLLKEFSSNLESIYYSVKNTSKYIRQEYVGFPSSIIIYD